MANSARPEADDVGQHMGGVSQQCEAVGKYPANHFNDEITKGKRKSNLQRSAILRRGGDIFHDGFYEAAFPVRI
jgi:hypothetical protein